MNVGTTLIRLGVAPLLSSALAGALVLPMLLVSQGLWSFDFEALETLVVLLPLAGLFGIVFAGLPAWFFGGILWGMGGSNAEARRPEAWVTAGAGAGWLVYLLFGLWMDGMAAPILPFLVTGALSALAFRWVMRVTQPATSYSSIA